MLWAPAVDLQSQDGAVRVRFDSHYKQGQSPQTAQLVARFDDAAPVVVESFARNRLDEQVDVSIPVPAGERCRHGGLVVRREQQQLVLDDRRRADQRSPAGRCSTAHPLPPRSPSPEQVRRFR
ncbi:hypothetical protein JM654_06270 [Microbacterium oxydans]|nr:hypothetical protein [Microbacterium oxydans]